MSNQYDLQFLKETFALLEDGTLVWATRPRHHFVNDAGMNRFNARCAGQPVGMSCGPKGHLSVPVSYQGKLKAFRPYVSRVVYSLANDVHLTKDLVIDHEDGDVTNNKPDNLRAVPIAFNNRNAIHRPGKSGIVGVREAKSGGWDAVLGSHRDGQYVYVGRFPTKEAAFEARCRVGRDLGYTERHLTGGNRTDLAEAV